MIPLIDNPYKGGKAMRGLVIGTIEWPLCQFMLPEYEHVHVAWHT